MKLPELNGEVKEKLVRIEDDDEDEDDEADAGVNGQDDGWESMEED